MSNRPRQDSSLASLASGDALQRLLDTLEEGVLFLRDDRVAGATPAFARMRGEPAEGFGGRTLSELFTDSAGRPLADPVRADGVRLRSADGTLVPVCVRRVASDVLVVVDRSRERVLEQEVWRLSRGPSVEERRSDSECWEALLGMVEHEIRTAITVILGYTRMLLEGQAGPLAETPREFLREVQRASMRVESLLANLLEIGPGGYPVDLPLVRKLTSLPDILRSGAETVRPLAEEREVRVTLALHPEAGPLHADPDRLEQVVTNLLTNAVKFSPRGATVRVESGLEEDGQGELVWIAVRDEGPGVHPDEAKRIFRPFVRGSASEGCGVRGVGLGLAICHKIVEAHGGSIEAVPSPDGGLFRITLPLGV